MKHTEEVAEVCNHQILRQQFYTLVHPRLCIHHTFLARKQHSSLTPPLQSLLKLAPGVLKPGWPWCPSAMSSKVLSAVQCHIATIPYITNQAAAVHRGSISMPLLGLLCA